MVVFDECHKAKNPTSTQGKNLLKLAKIGTYHYGLQTQLLGDFFLWQDASGDGSAYRGAR